VPICRKGLLGVLSYAARYFLLRSHVTSQADQATSEDASGATWADAVGHVQALLHHIVNMTSSETLLALRAAAKAADSAENGSRMGDYYDALYQSGSQPAKVLTLVVRH